MIISRARIVLGVILSTHWAIAALSHEVKEENEAVALHGEAVEIAVTVDFDTAAPVVTVARGANLHVSVVGAGTHELHLHGYDISVDAEEGAPAMFVFQAIHSGRFAIVAHDVEDLLGRGERPVAYVEVRAE